MDETATTNNQKPMGTPVRQNGKYIRCSLLLSQHGGSDSKNLAQDLVMQYCQAKVTYSDDFVHEQTGPHLNGQEH